MDGNQPLVTVVTPCHDAEAFVGETIESVLAQSYPAVEHVVVDDGSRDGSPEVAEWFADRWPGRVRAFRLDANRGGSHARNRGAAEARGELLMFLDADDVLAPGAVSALVAALRDPAAGVAVCRWERLRRGPDGEWGTGPADAPLPASDPDEALRGWLDGSAWAPPCAVLWRRGAYEAVGGWDESLTLNDDGDLMIRALAGGTRIAQAVGGGALYRWHDAARVSVSQSFLREDKLRSQVRVLDKLRALLEGQGRTEAFAEALGTAYQHAALLGFQSGHLALARECLRTGKALAGRRIVSPKPVGRALELIFGLERKERLVQALARYGMMTPQRRRISRLRETQAAAGPGGGAR